MFAALSIFVIAATSLSTWTIQESAAFSLFPQQPSFIRTGTLSNEVSGTTTVSRSYLARPIVYRRLTRPPTTTTVLFMAAAAGGSSPNWNSNDPFAVLGLDPSPNLDKKAIKRAYKRLALQYHPDMTTTKDSSAEDKRIASDRFAKINWAYEILSGKREAAGASSTAGASSSSSSTSTGGWTPPHRRSGAYASSSSSSAGKSTASTDWRDYMPGGGYYKDDTTNYDTGGDSFGKIFSDLFAGGVAAGRAAAGGGGGIFKDFVEFLEKNVDGYASVGRGGSGGPGIVEDAELQMILQTGSLEDVGDEMDETELVVKQLTAKLQNVDNEILMLTAELASTTKFTEKLQIEERIEELQARRKVAESYIKKARKRLLALQTRYKEMIVNGDNDPVAGGRSRSYSSSWDTEPSSKNEPSSRSSSYSSSSSQRTSSASSTTTDRNDDSSWKADEGFGSFGRGRGSSRRRARREGESTSPSGSSYSSNTGSTSSSSSSYRASPDSNTAGFRSNTFESNWQSTSNSLSSSPSSTSSSSSSSSSSSTYVPPHRRSPNFPASQLEQDKQRLRELKVDDEFDKLKKELGL